MTVHACAAEPFLQTLLLTQNSLIELSQALRDVVAELESDHPRALAVLEARLVPVFEAQKDRNACIDRFIGEAEARMEPLPLGDIEL